MTYFEPELNYPLTRESIKSYNFKDENSKKLFYDTFNRFVLRLKEELYVELANRGNHECPSEVYERCVDNFIAKVKANFIGCDITVNRENQDIKINWND
jgi:hypothetical protein